MTERKTYSLAEVRDGTGWPKGVRFAVVEPEQEVGTTGDDVATPAQADVLERTEEE